MSASAVIRSFDREEGGWVDNCFVSELSVCGVSERLSN